MASKKVYRLKQQSTRVGMQLEKALASSCYEWLLDGLVRVDQLGENADYTIRDLILRAKDAVDLITNIRRELKQVIGITKQSR